LRQIKKGCFTIPFGYRWTFLNHGVWEERFGLKITLNTVGPNSLRRIDKKNMPSVPKDPKVIENLNKGLIDNIKNNNFDKVWMAVPELVDWVDISGFSTKMTKTI